jgi:hypothetical protein
LFIIWIGRLYHDELENDGPVNPRYKFSIKLEKYFKLSKGNKMNNVWLLINETQIYVYIKGKDMKIDPKSFLVNVWLRNVNPVQLRSSIKFQKEEYKEIKQIKYKKWGFDTCSKGMDMGLWK